MKKKINIVLIFLLTAAIFHGCEDRSVLTGPTPQSPVSGSVDLSRYVAIGNSLTAGYQSSALYMGAQAYAYPNLIAKQGGNGAFSQPLISEPGIGGKIKIVSLSPFVTAVEPSSGVPLFLTNPQPYNNLGIPGIVLADVMNSKTTATSYSKSPFIDIILRGKGTQFVQAKAQSPSLITLWIGNNDVLGFATSGGVRPSSPTDANTFAFLFSQLADSLAATGAKVVVANIPDVTAIPFFTTVGPGIALKLSSLGINGMYYQAHGQYNGTALPISSLANYSALITLVGQSYASLIGTPTGKFYRDNKVDITLLIAGGILDTTKAFGLDPKNPWPDALILDPSEITTAKNATAAFNTTISAVAGAKGFGLVNINTMFNQIRANDATGGTSFNGVTFTTTFVTGGLFSLDGVHPTNQGQAIIANEFLKVINSKFGSTYPLIDVSTIPGSLNLAKRVAINYMDINTYIDPDFYKHLFF